MFILTHIYYHIMVYDNEGMLSYGGFYFVRVMKFHREFIFG